jgi:hypothetical protein
VTAGFPTEAPRRQPEARPKHTVTKTTSMSKSDAGFWSLPNCCRHDVESLTTWRVQLRRVKHAVLPTWTSRPNPLAVGGRLFVSVFSPGAVLCLNRDCGSVIWRRRLAPFGGAHVLHVNSLLYAKTTPTLYCLDPDTGRMVWKFSPYGPDGETIYSAPAVKDGRLFIGDRRGYLHALDARSGRPLWRTLTSRASNNDVNGPPLLHRDRVLVATNAGRFLSIDAATGSIVWNERVGHPCINEIVVNPDAFVVLTSVALNWVDRQTGKLLERRALPRRRWIRALASKGHNLMVALSNGKGGCEVLGFRNTNLLFSKEQDPIKTLQWLPSGLLVETRYDGIGVLNPVSGERLCDVVFHEHCEAAQPAEADGHLYVLTAMGAVFALRWPPSAR